MNRYQADLREIQFVLFQQLGLADLLSKAPFEEWGPDEVKMVLEEAYRFASSVTGPLNASGDREGCRLEDGNVLTPKGFKEAWKQSYEAGWRSLSNSPDEGGQGAPYVVHAAVEEFMSGSNTSFNMYPGLAHGAADVIREFGTDRQKKLFVSRMVRGAWGGTMCLTEAHAGSDVGSATSSAKKNPDGTYSIRGSKIFISGGDHDLADNIVHLVLARIEGAAAGTKGLSLFIVPKHRVSDDGTLTGPNDVTVAAIEHKLGINGSATCQLNFGENGACVGELVGNAEHQGIRQMFIMMNFARIG
ncbi:MAG: acyl-CoA dehydrogenase, partial [Myxococcales bacterium]|nr:acyl-CoA dehydrogenase [Myxococcales bacterium]